MKMKLCAVLLAALAALSACSSAASPDVSPARPSASASEAAAQPEQTAPAAEAPAQEASNATQENSAFSDEPQLVQADLDEVVTYSLRFPKVTLESSAATEAVNAGFSSLRDSLIRYAEETVYPSAQQQMAIGFLSSDYTISASDGVLTVAYTVLESYGSTENPVSRETVYSFDLSTGELLPE